MTSAVYLLLKHDQQRAQELCEATFADIHSDYRGRKFETAGHQRTAIKFRYLARRFQLAVDKHAAGAEAEASKALKEQNLSDQEIIDLKQNKPDVYQDWLEQNFLVNSACFVDFCVARGLGYVFKKIAKARYDGEKTEFNLEFSDPQPLDYRAVTRFGNFALRTNNLAFIFKEILGAQGVHIASKHGATAATPLAPPVAGVTSSSFSNVEKLKQEFKDHFKKGQFALVSVFGDLCQQGDQVDKPSPAGIKEGDRLAYNHWVVFNGFEWDVKKKRVNLQVWTWKKDYDIEVREEHLLSYIQDVIFGNF
jgi:hypothetical protein